MADQTCLIYSSNGVLTPSNKAAILTSIRRKGLPLQIFSHQETSKALHATHHLMLMIICGKYGKNPSRTRHYRADTIFKVKAEWPWKYRSRSKVITCDPPSDANDITMKSSHRSYWNTGVTANRVGQGIPYRWHLHCHPSKILELIHSAWHTGNREKLLKCLPHMNVRYLHGRSLDSGEPSVISSLVWRQEACQPHGFSPHDSMAHQAVWVSVHHSTQEWHCPGYPC